MTATMPHTGPLPVLTHAELHPDWCDPRSCGVDTPGSRGDDLTGYQHKLVLLDEPDRHITVDVWRYDYRNADGALVDEFSRPTEPARPRVYVGGLGDRDLDQDQARRLAEALARAAAVVAGAVTR